MDYIFLIVIVVAMFGMMFWQSKKAKQQQAERQDFRANLQPGTEVITIGGVIGKVVSVDTEYEEIVIDSEVPRFVSASTPSAVNMCVPHMCMMTRSMRMATCFPPILQMKIRLPRSRLRVMSKWHRLRPNRRTTDNI